MQHRLAFLTALALMIAPLGAAEAKGGIATAAEPRATAAGQEILRKGGSATDAAMAMMLALTVVEPQSSGIGGGGFLVHHDGPSGKTDTIDGRETAPASARPAQFLGTDGKPRPFGEIVPGGLSVGVPGNIRLMAEAHRRWGKLKWAKLFQPAIRLAEEGYVLLPEKADGQGYVPLAGLPRRLDQIKARWEKFPDARALYWENGAPKGVGAVVRNPQLGKTLRRIAAKGPDAFYTGVIGADIRTALATSPVNPATMTPADLAGYQAKQRPPLCGIYRGYRICGMGSPSAGATSVLAILGLLERFDMATLGSDNPVSWHLIGEAMRLTYADRDRWLGDSDFVAAPFAGMLDRGYLATRSALISENAVLAKYEAGSPPGARPLGLAPSINEQGTTHFNVVDGKGDIVSMTSTIEGPFGSSLMVGGFFLNNELTDFSSLPEKDGRPVANRVEPGKRPLSSMAPTIVYDPAGKPVLALGSAGGRTIIMHVVKALIGVIDWKLPADQAMALPNIFFNANGLVVERGTPLDVMRPALAALGQTVVAGDIPSKLTILQHGPGGWTGAADPRGIGTVLGE